MIQQQIKPPIWSVEEKNESHPKNRYVNTDVMSPRHHAKPIIQPLPIPCPKMNNSENKIIPNVHLKKNALRCLYERWGNSNLTSLRGLPLNKRISSRSFARWKHPRRPRRSCHARWCLLRLLCSERRIQVWNLVILGWNRLLCIRLENNIVT